MAEPLHSFEVLSAGATEEMLSGPICVLFGDDEFLKRQVLLSLRSALTQDNESDDAEMSVCEMDGDSAQLKDVFDELATISLFGGGARRVVVIKSADDFVSANRGELESYLEKPFNNSILILTLGKFQKTTRLYKAVAKIGSSIDCGPPQRKRGKSISIDESAIVNWIVSWSKENYQFKIAKAAARQVLDLTGTEFGLLDQNLAKLSLYVEPKQTAEIELANEVVGGWQTKSTWEMVDAAADGNVAEAIKQLQQLLQAGQHPNALFGQIAWSLRRYADAAEVFHRSKREKNGMGFDAALEYAGFRRWGGEIEDAKRRMKQMGRERIAHLHRWLLMTDLSLKGSHSAPERAKHALEKLIFFLADKQPT